MRVHSGTAHTVAAEVLTAVGVEHAQAQVRTLHFHAQQAVPAHAKSPIAHPHRQLRKFAGIHVRQMNEREIV
jgi:hypothetical protein